MSHAPGRDVWKKLVFAQRFARRKLVHLNLQILYDCNFRCRICDFWKESYVGKPRLSIEQVRVVAEKLRSLGPHIISIGGGEPLMHPNLLPIAETLAPDHFLVMITNGWFVTRENAAALWQTGVYEVSVSVDYADPERHDAQRATKGAHARALEALRLLHETRVHPQQRVNMISVVMDDNLEDVERLVELSAEMGISYLVTLYSHGRGTKARRVGDRELGARLLDRTPQGLVPTAAGTAIVPRAGKAPLVIVDVLARAGAPDPEPHQLVVRDRDGRWTPEFQRVRTGS